MCVVYFDVGLVNQFFLGNFARVVHDILPSGLRYPFSFFLVHFSAPFSDRRRLFAFFRDRSFCFLLRALQHFLFVFTLVAVASFLFLLTSHQLRSAAFVFGLLFFVNRLSLTFSLRICSRDVLFAVVPFASGFIPEAVFSLLS